MKREGINFAVEGAKEKDNFEVALGSKNYISANDLDISFEPDVGRGAVDFKVSHGGDKTFVGYQKIFRFSGN